VLKYWDLWVGNSDTFTVEERGVHAIMAISVILLLTIIPINLIVGLKFVAFTLFMGIIGVAILYVLSRIYRKTDLAILLYGLGSYGLMTFSFFANSGSFGPTMFLFFLTFQLLIATSTERYQWVWVSMHLMVPVFLISLEYMFAGSVPDNYVNPLSRFFDIITSYLVSIVFIYFVTHYLRQMIDKEKQLAIDRAIEIDKQNHELERLNEEKSKLFSIISHDLRSPINSIQSYLEMLNKFPINSEQGQKVQAQLLEQTRNTSMMLNNLLTWSKGQMQGIHTDIKPISVIKIIEETIKVHDPNAQHKDIEIYVDSDTNLLAMADFNLIQIAVRNLINNAIKFTRNGGKVKVKVESDQDEIVIKVIDNGIGITAEAASKLLNPDGRMQTTYGTNNEKGMGLGLRLAKEYIELNHGSLTFESVYGEGSTFTIRIPAAVSVETE